MVKHTSNFFHPLAGTHFTFSRRTCGRNSDTCLWWGAKCRFCV